MRKTAPPTAAAPDLAGLVVTATATVVHDYAGRIVYLYYGDTPAATLPRSEIERLLADGQLGSPEAASTSGRTSR